MSAPLTARSQGLAHRAGRFAATVSTRCHISIEQRVRVGPDLLLGQPRPRLGAPGRIAHPGGEVPDDQHGLVAQVLKLSQLAELDRPAERHHPPPRVQAELDPERPAERQLTLELLGRRDLCVSSEQRG